LVAALIRCRPRLRHNSSAPKSEGGKSHKAFLSGKIDTLNSPSINIAVTKVITAGARRRSHHRPHRVSHILNLRPFNLFLIASPLELWSRSDPQPPPKHWGALYLASAPVPAKLRARSSDACRHDGRNASSSIGTPAKRRHQKVEHVAEGAAASLD